MVSLIWRMILTLSNPISLPGTQVLERQPRSIRTRLLPSRTAADRFTGPDRQPSTEVWTRVQNRTFSLKYPIAKPSEIACETILESPSIWYDGPCALQPFPQRLLRSFYRPSAPAVTDRCRGLGADCATTAVPPWCRWQA